MRANKRSQIDTLEIKIFRAATLKLVYKLTGPPKKCKCFSESAFLKVTVSVE